MRTIFLFIIFILLSGCAASVRAPLLPDVIEIEYPQSASMLTGCQKMLTVENIPDIWRSRESGLYLEPFTLTSGGLRFLLKIWSLLTRRFFLV